MADDRPIGTEILACKLPRFGTILADPPWPFATKNARAAPDNPDRFHYHTLPLRQIARMPVERMVLPRAHLYLWITNNLIDQGIYIMRRWGFVYKTNLVWCKTRHDGRIDGRGIGNYFRYASELVLFGVRGSLLTGKAARRQTNVILANRREHSRKPDDLYSIIEACSPGPRLELFARYPRPGWYQWGNQLSPKLQTNPDAMGGPTTAIHTTRTGYVIYRPAKEQRE